MLTAARRTLLVIAVLLLALPAGIRSTDAMPPITECPDGYVLRNGLCIADDDGDDDPTGCVSRSGYNVPCTNPVWGEWSNELGCYLTLVRPQPEYDNPIWQGRTTGAIYWCTVMSTGSVMGVWDDQYQIWLADGPGPDVDPEDVAEEILIEMDLQPITIGIAPTPTEQNPDAIGLVGAPIWMWASNPGPQTWGPITASDSAGGITVTVTAQVDEATWSMGDGGSKTCAAPGDAYRESYGVRRSPSCGYQYERTSREEPNQAYAVTATTTWSATWEASTGASGTLDVDPLSSTAHVRIGERQLIEQ